MITKTCSIAKFPVLFLSHGGGPAAFLDSRGDLFSCIDMHSPSRNFMVNLKSFLPEIPKAVVVVSAHWEETQFSLGYQTRGTSLVYDYYGFPEESYAPHLTYSAPTDLGLADRIFNSLKNDGLTLNKMDRGFDHGVFIPMKLAFPEANIPIVQVSLKSSLGYKEHIELGKKLSFLRDEGVLILCSGHTTHNLGSIGRRSAVTTKRMEEFESWMAKSLEDLSPSTKKNVESIFEQIESNAPNLREAHPRTEHLIPIHVALGAVLGKSSDSETPIECRRIYHEMVLGSLSMDSYIFQ